MAEKLRPVEQMLELSEDEANSRRASGLASAKSAGATAATQAPAGADRKTKTRAGRTKSSPGGIGTRPGGNER